MVMSKYFFFYVKDLGGSHHPIIQKAWFFPVPLEYSMSTNPQKIGVQHLRASVDCADVQKPL